VWVVCDLPMCPCCAQLTTSLHVRSPRRTEYNPVCGCDFLTYASTCQANSFGVSVRSTGVCPLGSVVASIPTHVARGQLPHCLNWLVCYPCPSASVLARPRRVDATPLRGSTVLLPLAHAPAPEHVRSSLFSQIAQRVRAASLGGREKGEVGGVNTDNSNQEATTIHTALVHWVVPPLSRSRASAQRQQRCAGATVTHT